MSAHFHLPIFLVTSSVPSPPAKLAEWRGCGDTLRLMSALCRTEIGPAPHPRSLNPSARKLPHRLPPVMPIRFCKQKIRHLTARSSPWYGGGVHLYRHDYHELPGIWTHTSDPPVPGTSCRQARNIHTILESLPASSPSAENCTHVHRERQWNPGCLWFETRQ